MCDSFAKVKRSVNSLRGFAVLHDLLAFPYESSILLLYPSWNFSFQDKMSDIVSCLMCWIIQLPGWPLQQHYKTLHLFLWLKIPHVEQPHCCSQVGEVIPSCDIHTAEVKFLALKSKGMMGSPGNWVPLWMPQFYIFHMAIHGCFIWEKVSMSKLGLLKIRFSK